MVLILMIHMNVFLLYTSFVECMFSLVILRLYVHSEPNVIINVNEQNLGAYNSDLFSWFVYKTIINNEKIWTVCVLWIKYENVLDTPHKRNNTWQTSNQIVWTINIINDGTTCGCT